MERLQIETKDRPVPVPTRPAASIAMAVVDDFDFDPYKTSIVRTAPQPTRGNGLSQTEAQLENLNKRRRELEGSIESVSRETKVLLPRLDGTVASLQEFLDNGEKDEGGQQPTASSSSSSSSRVGGPANEVSDSTILARSIAAQMKAGGSSSAGLDEPMTTKAVRDLRKAMTERVYGKTLVRVKFPDRCCVQAYFHPRHTINDVYRWLRETCLKEELVTAAASSSSSSSSSAVKSAGGKAKVPYGLQGAPIASSSSSTSSSVTLTTAVDYLIADYLFELYTTPPRCVLHPYAKSQQQQNHGSSSVFQAQQPPQYTSLLELKFVPAVMLHCSWAPALAAEIKTATESTATATATAPMAPGEAYLLSELWQQAAASNSSATAAADASSFPAGAPLALDRSASSSTAADNNNDSNNDGKDGGDGQTSSKPKPKWLKI